MSTFSNEDKLPRLPVPDLKDTCEKYLKTLIPVSNEDEIKNSKEIVKSFLETEGTDLQKKLLHRSKTEQYSWLETWWSNYAYMEYQDPLTINVSYQFCLKDLPQPTNQVFRAASLIDNIMTGKKALEEETFPPEMRRGAPVCMVSYKYFFHSCRMPHKTRDYTVTYKPSEATNIVVMRNGQFYSFEAYYSDGQILSRRHFEEQISKILKLEEKSKQKYPPIGVFTAQNRATWAEIKEHMLKNETNKKSFEMVHKCILICNLDSCTPTSEDEMCSILISGGNGEKERINRFMDIPIQIVVFENGTAGLVGEHSRMDGQPITYMMDWILEKEFNGMTNTTNPPKEVLPEPMHLAWDLKGLEPDLLLAESNLEKLCRNLDMTRLVFKDFGKKHIISSMGVSPDSVIQAAFQMTYYKQHKKFTAVYESIATRQYRRGRTETGRTFTPEMREFVETFEDNNVSKETKIQKFLTAEKAHVSYLRDAIKGYGVDRHLLGLKLITLESGQKLHPIFTDPLFSRSCHWSLSTSQLEVKYIDSIGFGPVVPDGYGICYIIKDESVTFTITAWNSDQTTSTKTFRKNLIYYLNALKQLLDNRPRPKSKL